MRVLLLLFWCNILLGQSIPTAEDLHFDNSTETNEETVLSVVGRPFEYDINRDFNNPNLWKQLYFLNAIQQEQIRKHRTATGYLHSFNELQIYPCFKSVDIKNLQSILRISMANKTSSSLSKKNKHMLTIRNEGYLQPTKGSTNKKYLGSGVRSLLKYKCQPTLGLEIGVIAEKDRGEPISFKHNPSGFDHIGFYVSKSFQQHNLQQLIVGDYQLSFGMGLVFGGTVHLGITASPLLNSGTLTKGIGPYRSSMETGYFRGAIATFKFQQLRWTPFVSLVKKDAQLDSLNQVTSMPPTGYHRTLLELEKKNNLQQHSIGSNVEYLSKNNKMSIGIHSLFHRFDKEFSIQNVPFYKKPAAKFQTDKSGLHALYFKAYANGICMFSEIASNNFKNIASVSGIAGSAGQNGSFSILHRYYPIDFLSRYGKAFSNKSMTNEHGVYVGFKSPITHELTISTYIDQSFSQWIRYNLNQPATSTLGHLSFQYKKKRQRSIQLTYQFKKQYTNSALVHLDTTINSAAHQLQLKIEIQVKTSLKLRSHWIGKITKSTEANQGWAWILSLQGKGKRIRWEVQASTHQSSNFDSRMYHTENNIYPFRKTNLLSGAGFRSYIFMNYKIKYFDLGIKLDHNNRFDKKELGSGYGLITSPVANYLVVQLNYQL